MDELQTAFLLLMACGRLHSPESAVAQYISTQEATRSQINQFFHWKSYKTTRAIYGLLKKKVITKQPCNVFIINPIWRDWCNGIVASMQLKVQPEDFSKLISEELIQKLVRFCQGRGVHLDEAEDIVQNSLLKARKYFLQLRPGSNFESWLFQITKNTLRDYWKKCKEVQYFETEMNQITDESISEVLEQRANFVQFKGYLSRLPNYYQELLELWSDEIPYTEVSILLNIPVGTVKSKMSKAKQALKDIIINK